MLRHLACVGHGVAWRGRYAGFVAGGGGGGAAVYSIPHAGGRAGSAAAGVAMDSYAALAPDETLAASQRRERNARLSGQTGYVDWELRTQTSASGEQLAGGAETVA